MRGIMRTRIYTTRLLQMRTKIARSRLLLDRGLLPPRVFRVIGHYLERMQIDISIRAIPRAQSATDAPILDNHFQRIAPPNRSYRATDHAQRIAALPATCRDQIVIEA